ncbi:uncharacterized protein LOC133313584 [Gastrolobium bilobum]|uniref:uncharacterized protein LOC133313584 n=1 Tax=Gastrolobium bilobum TaxID=150636 RepID=UPI002AB1920F|nr:uncharacterized protein LOC133313584 [Gastrolobium bilobum]
MEDCNDNGKRVRDDSPESETHLVDSPESKTRRVDSVSDSGVNSSVSQLTRVDSGESGRDSSLDSACVTEVNLEDDLLNILDDAADSMPERNPAIQGLDSVIKSFEEEILASGSDSGLVDPDPTMVQMDPTLVPDSGELQQNLGYLFEASDDELGLPPTAMPGEKGMPEDEEPGRVGPEGVDLTGFLGFEDDFPNYDAFGFGGGLLEECDGDNGGAGGLVMADGLFDYSEPAADSLWRSESLQAM